MNPDIRIRRVYEPPEPDDGLRVLVDRLWPRGLSKEKAAADFWARELAPSDGLRRWFDHEGERWEEFKRRYANELDRHPEAVQELLARAAQGTVTLIYAARETRWNNAVALKAYLEARVAGL